MKLAILISAAAWLIAAAYRWAMRPPPAPEMTAETARRIVRQSGARHDTVDAPPKLVAAPVDLALFANNVLPFSD